MTFVRLSATLLLASLSLSAQLAPTIRTFIGNGRSDAAFFGPGLSGVDVSRYSIRPEGISVDQAGNVTLGVGFIVRVTRGARFIASQTALGVGAGTVATSPTGFVAGAGLFPCFMTATAPGFSGAFSVRTSGSCTGAPQDSGDGGNFAGARFLSIKGIGVDREGDIYIYDGDAGKVRHVDSSGTIRTVATGISLSGGFGSVPVLLPAHPSGGVVGVSSTDDSLLRIHSRGIERFSIPEFFGGVFTWDLDDNFYYFRRSDEALVRRTPNGLVTVIGLNGFLPFTEGMAARDLNQRAIDGIAADTAGNVYVFVRVSGRNVASDPVDFRVLRIQLPGVGRADCSFSVTSATAPASGGAQQIGVTASAAGCYWSASSTDAWLQVPAAQQRGSGNLTVNVNSNTGGARSGAISIGGQSFTIAQSAGAAAPVDPAGTITTFAGAAGQSVLTPLTTATPLANFRFGAVGEMAFDSRGDLFVADWAKYQIFRIANGMVTPVAGIGGFASTTPEGYGGAATSARLASPYALAIDGNDYIYTARRQAVERFRLGGTFERVANGTDPIGPIKSAYDAPRQRVLFGMNGLYALNGNSLTQISGRTPNTPADGTPLAEAYVSADGIAVDAAGNIYFSESTRRRVRKVTPDGIMTTLAGTGVLGSNGDNGPATAAQLSLPLGLAVDRSGNVYIADNVANRVRRVRPDGIIETVVGNGTRASTGDGGRASAAPIDSPTTLALDAEGSLYIGTSVGSIRKITFPRPASSISSGGVVNLSGGALSPGALFSIYGANLGGAPQSAAAFPLPTTLGGVSVLVNGAAVPLAYVSAGQINAQMPFGLAAGRAMVSVRNATGTTEAAVVDIVSAGPAILEYGARRAVATAGSGAINTNDAPAAAGDVVIVYLTGIGAVDPAVPTGAPAPLDALSRAVLPASATVGGRPADILFLGLAPGFAGLAQANLVVPQLSAGQYPVEITVGGVTSNSPSISVR